MIRAFLLQEKIPEAFRIAYGQLIQTVGAFEERMRSATDLIDNTISFRGEDCLDFEAVSFSLASLFDVLLVFRRASERT